MLDRKGRVPLKPNLPFERKADNKMADTKDTILEAMRMSPFIGSALLVLLSTITKVTSASTMVSCVALLCARYDDG